MSILPDSNNYLFYVFKSGGVFLYILLVCSVIFVAVTGERLYFYFRNKFNYDSALRRFSILLSEDKFDEINAMLDSSDKIQLLCARAIIMRKASPKDEIEDAVQAVMERVLLQFEKRVFILGILAVISPFIGLAGTVVGIMRAFADIAVSSSSGAAVVAGGVSEALIATAAGLLVAIPASAFFNYFRAKIKSLRSELGVFCAELIELVVRIERGDKPIDVLEIS